jgi:aminopeptidase N
VHGWRDIWLNEGIATWLEVLWDHNRGFATPQEWLQASWESARRRRVVLEPHHRRPGPDPDVR